MSWRRRRECLGEGQLQKGEVDERACVGGCVLKGCVQWGVYREDEY